MFSEGVRVRTPVQGFVPLIEQSSPDLVYPQNLGGETSLSAACNEVSFLNSKYSFIASCCGRSAKTLKELKKNGTTGAFEEGISQMQAAQALLGAVYDPAFWVIIHGQGDEAVENTNYKQDLFGLQSDISQAIGKTITLIQAQICSWTYLSSKTYPTAGVPFAQLQAALEHPNIIMACPQYFLPHLSDGIHLTNLGQQWQGEFVGKAMHAFLNGQKFQPLYATGAAWDATSRTVTVSFYVPVPPLAWDLVNVVNPGNYGFVVTDSTNNKLLITQVSLSATSVAIAVGGSATPRQVSYAAYGTPNTNAGPVTGSRGNLVDSDNTPSLYKNDLRNRCLVFDVTVT